MTFRKENSVNQAPENRNDKGQRMKDTGSKHGRWKEHYHLIPVYVTRTARLDLKFTVGFRQKAWARVVTLWRYSLRPKQFDCKRKSITEFYNSSSQQQVDCAHHPCTVAAKSSSRDQWMQAPNNPAENDFFSVGAVQALLGKCRGRGDREYLNLLQLVRWDKRLLLVSCAWRSIHATQPRGLYRHERGLVQGSESLVSCTVAP